MRGGQRSAAPKPGASETRTRGHRPRHSNTPKPRGLLDNCGRQVFWLMGCDGDEASSRCRAFPVLDEWHLQHQTHLQRRDRVGFTPTSLFVPVTET